jgi:thiol-disulfide isomerase/thioredoxin
LVGLQTWINSNPQTLASLKGKVVLIDFWTYSCINCQRTLPYVQKWYDTYKDKGLVVIGVHAPEFGFEKVEANVRKAVQDDHLTYPVALDNNFDTWNAYGNQYWPAHYLIDRSGNIRQAHFGEGAYQETEQAIQLLLGTSRPLTAPSDGTPSDSSLTPETYLGTARTGGYVGSPDLQDGQRSYSPSPITTNQWTLNGTWAVAGDGITSKQNAKITYKIRAKEAYLVVSSSGNQKLDITTDGVKQTISGESLTNGVLQLNGARLYHLSHLTEMKNTTVEISLPAGVTLNTFTFGG